MKKIILLLGVFLTLVMLYGCKTSYTEEAGLYELYDMSGDIQLADFQYYTIELFEDGNLVVKSRGSNQESEPYEAVATYRIKSNQITITTKVGFSNVKEVYDYIDGEIHMIEVEVPGSDIVYSARFRRSA